jgi:soluble lytic murein transglycosylase-like protein
MSITIRKFLKMFSLRDGLVFACGVGITILAVVAIRLVIASMATPLLPYDSAGITASWIPSTVRHWDGLINQMAAKYNIDANVVAIIMTMESGGDANAKSGANAVGLMQITPIAARDISAQRLQQPVTKYNLNDPATNIEFGTAYLAYLRDVFGDSTQSPSWDHTVELVAAGYNGGPRAAGNLEKGNGLHSTQTVVYSRDAFNMWRERHVSDSPTFDRWKERGGDQLLQAAAASQTPK